MFYTSNCDINTEIQNYITENSQLNQHYFWDNLPPNVIFTQENWKKLKGFVSNIISSILKPNKHSSKNKSDPNFGRGGVPPSLMKTPNQISKNDPVSDFFYWLGVKLGLIKDSGSQASDNSSSKDIQKETTSTSKNSVQSNGSKLPKDQSWQPIKQNVRQQDGKIVQKTFQVKKIENVPYFNQCLEANGSSFPADCWQMCGAASAVILAGQQGKLKYDPKDPQTLKKYMYSDNGQGITQTCGTNKGGAFGITGGYDAGCDQNSFSGIKQYLKHEGIEAKVNSSGILDEKAVKKSIDEGKPVIMGMTAPANHIFVVVGYTNDGGYVVNDSYRNANLNYNEEAGKYVKDGKDVVYYFNKPGYPTLGSQLFIK